ncbi:hypothetical protein BVY04_01585 [bacterium M21]|nr:hypothetical protein BVY04_01585 [bacterium M21]
MRWIGCLLCLLVTAVVTAQERAEKVDERISELNEQMEVLTNRLNEGLQLHGFISQGWMKSGNNWLGNTEDGSFDFNEFGLNVMTNLSENFHLGMQMMSREMGHYSTGSMTIDWAYGDYQFDERMGVRVGRVRTPIGMHNESRDIDPLRVPIFLPQSVYAESTRDVTSAVNGLALYGNLELGRAGSFDYLTWVGGITINPDEGLGRLIEDSGVFIVNDIDIDYSVGCNVYWNTPLHGLRLTGVYDAGRGVEITQVTTAALIPMGIPAGTPATGTIAELEISGGGVGYDLGRLNLSAEYSYIRGDMETSIANGAVTMTQNIDYEGYYGMATYELTHRLAIAGSYSEYYPNADDRDGTTKVKDWYAWQKDAALSTRYNITPNWSIKGEIHFINGTGQLLRGDNPDGYDKHWRSYLLKTSYTF